MRRISSGAISDSPRWAALIERAYALGRLDRFHRIRLWQEMSWRGYRLREPVEFEPEVPTLIPELVRVHMEELNYSSVELADMLLMTEGEFRQKYLGEGPGLTLVT